jgi:hypothetical protein
MKGTDFYTEVSDLLKPDIQWTQTNENKLVFEGQYQPRFYWFAERLLHNEMGLYRIVKNRRFAPAEFVDRLAKTVICRAGTKVYSWFPNDNFKNRGSNGKERVPRLSY